MMTSLPITRFASYSFSGSNLCCSISNLCDAQVTIAAALVVCREYCHILWARRLEWVYLPPSLSPSLPPFLPPFLPPSVPPSLPPSLPPFLPPFLMPMMLAHACVHVCLQRSSPHPSDGCHGNKEDHQWPTALGETVHTVLWSAVTGGRGYCCHGNLNSSHNILGVIVI